MLQAGTRTAAATTTQPTLVLCELGRPPVPGLESYSPFCVKVHRALKAAGLVYTSRHATTPDGHRELNPQRQVPVLLLDGRPISDSTPILAALAALEPTPPWVAADPRERAEALLWEELADTALNGFLVAARWADDRNWPNTHAAFFGAAPWPVRRVIAPALRRRMISRLVARDIWRAGPDACWTRFQILLDALDDRAPTTGFWLGERLGLADISLHAQLQGLCTPLTPWQQSQVEARPRLRAWLARVDQATR
jgi:glutathione S-transferase